jgi:hypothetical protein
MSRQECQSLTQLSINWHGRQDLPPLQVTNGPGAVKPRRAASGPGPDRCLRGVHALGPLWTIRVLFWATVAVLLFTRRFRHLFVFLRAVVGVIALSSLLAYLFMRPRPVCCSPPELGPGRRRIGAARGSPGSSSWITTSHLAIADTPACTTVLRPFPSSWMLDRPSGAASSKALTHH